MKKRAVPTKNRNYDLPIMVEAFHSEFAFRIYIIDDSWDVPNFSSIVKFKQSNFVRRICTLTTEDEAMRSPKDIIWFI